MSGQDFQGAQVRAEGTSIAVEGEGFRVGAGVLEAAREVQVELAAVVDRCAVAAPPAPRPEGASI